MGGAVVHRAADIGCGAGLSTRPLASLARMSVGFDPAESMVAYGDTSRPRCAFRDRGRRGDALRRPLHRPAHGCRFTQLRSRSGRHARRSRACARAWRPCWPSTTSRRAVPSPIRIGSMTGSRPSSRATPSPPARHDHCRHPCWQKPPRTSCWCAVRPSRFRSTLEPDFHIDYMLTETCVQDAVRRGTPLDSIRGWVTETLAPVFDGRSQTCCFAAIWRC